MAMAAEITATSSSSSAWSAVSSTAAAVSTSNFCNGSRLPVAANLASRPMMSLENDQGDKGYSHAKKRDDEACGHLFHEGQSFYGLRVCQIAAGVLICPLLLPGLKWNIAVLFGGSFFSFAFEHDEGVDDPLPGGMRFDDVIDEAAFGGLVRSCEFGGIILEDLLPHGFLVARPCRYRF